MKVWSFWLLLFCSVSTQAATQAEGYDDTNTKLGDVLQYAIPLVGLGLTWLLPTVQPASSTTYPESEGWLSWNRMSGEPRHDFVLAFARNEILTFAIKVSINAKRPNGGSQSFPSGHTSSSFMGAEFIRKEYGNWIGAPAYLAASYVGWTRQQSRYHYTRDVIAGALLGIVCNHDLSEFRSPVGPIGLAATLLPLDAASQPDEEAFMLGGGRYSDRPSPHASKAIPALRLQWQF